MTEFLCEDSIHRHREYLRTKRLKYSILNKSLKGLESENIREIARQKMDAEAKREALALLGEIKAHELYFDSFGAVRYPSSPLAVRQYGSCAALLNTIFRRCLDTRYGFVCAGIENGRVVVFHEFTEYLLFLRHTPLLAVDVCEHAYFADYGFDKERYLYTALSYLALNKLPDLSEI